MSKDVPKEMMQLADFDYLKGRIHHYVKEGYNSIGYLGGDVSIHPKIVDIIEYSRDVGFEKINIITNGMLFDNYAFARRILEAGTTRVNISVHSHKPEIEDALTRVHGGLKRKLQAIDNFNALYQEGVLTSPLSINIVVNQLNYKNIVETVLYFYKIKQIHDIRLNFVWLSDGVKADWDKITLTYTEFLPYMKKLIYLSLTHDVRITFDTVPACVFALIDEKNHDALVKRFLGEQYDIIDQIEHANIDDERERFLWKDKKKNVLKVKAASCKKCKYYPVCEGVWKEYKILHGLGELKPIII